MPPPHKPTDENRATVEGLVSFGITEVEIGRYLGIDPKTLRKHYRDELDNGMVKANVLAAQKLFEKVREGNLAACIFWLKARAGWSEKAAQKEPDDSNEPVGLDVKYVPAKDGKRADGGPTPEEVKAEAVEGDDDPWGDK